MVVAFRFDEGAEGTLHDHPHVPATYVEAGRFTLTIGDAEHDLGPADGLIIPSGVQHCCICKSAGTLIDIFTPRRNDVL
jgi:quercetin dioxygenase-like cupin family protein